MIEQVKLLSMTGVLTLVIWVAADSLVNEIAIVPVTFKLVSEAAGADRIVALAPQTETYQLTVAGPRKSIAQVHANSPLTLSIRVPDLPTGNSTIALREALQEQWREFRKVAVMSVQPPKLQVVVDRFTTKNVGVTMQNVALAYDVRPQIQPNETTVRIRESFLAEISTSGELPPVDITTEAERLLKERPAGQSVVVVVTLDPRIFGPDAQLKPKTVEVRATVTAQRLIAEIPTVPILIATSFANVGKPIRVMTRDGSELVTQTIRVTGLREEVAKLVRGETRAVGIIHLKDEHLTDFGTFKPFTPDFQLPMGIELTEKARPIELRLIRSDSASPEGNKTP
ncbi:MAG: hypothetical protein AABZ47_00995 [Planctomycetota bacterium]